jgi:predicted nuclease of predicted toxin-antitoxin system
VKFLADMGVSPLTVQALRQRGYDAVHLMDERLERLPDPQIMVKAVQEKRIVLTFDLDFGDLLAASADILPSVIIFRLKTPIPAITTERLLVALSEFESALMTGAILTVEDKRYRLRRLPIEPTSSSEPSTQS